MSKLAQYAKLESDVDAMEMRELDDAQRDAIVDDYKDLAIEMMGSSRDKRLSWIQEYD